MSQKDSYKLKSVCMKNITKKQNHGDIKDSSKLCYTDVLRYVADTASKVELDNICNDINIGDVKIAMDASTVDFIIQNAENENIKYLLKNVNKLMSIDIKDIKDLSSENFSKMQNLGCKVDKVYVNSGYDRAAAKGYDANVYRCIINKAEKMIETAMKQLPPNASEEQRFMAIYNVVLKNTVYDYGTVKAEAKANGGNVKTSDTSRNLEGFFVDETSVCAGTAMALEQLCKMNGIEAEYVQGNSKSPRETESHYHAWVKVKVDGKWFNADPTWDANKVGRPYQYCLKSDKDFKGHQVDTNYNPSYSRDGSTTSEKREYHSSYESRNSRDLESTYYTDDLRERAGGRALTSDEIRALNGRPDSSGISVKNTPIIVVIINKILNFGRWTKRQVQNVFSRNKVSKEEINSLSNKSDSEIKEYANSIRVDKSDLIEKKEESTQNQEKEQEEQSR